tara:strand:+ start:208 stop:786 length:579 start_codon:yes stop_codon:yes gene_type:complete
MKKTNNLRGVNMKSSEQNFTMTKCRLAYDPSNDIFLDEEEKKAPIKYWINNDVVGWKIGFHQLYLKDQEPFVGMDATYSIGTDSYPKTVVKVDKNYKGKGFDIITVQSDRCIEKNGTWNKEYHCESQSFDDINTNYYHIQYVKSNDFTLSDGRKAKFFTNVRWNPETKRFNKGSKFGRVSFGEKVDYLDPSL